MKILNYKQYPSIQCIYKIYTKDFKKVYIGSTINFKERIARHVNYLKNNKHHSNLLQRAVNKYGIEKFYVKILNSEKMTPSELHAKEIEYILKYNSVNRGYNMILNSKEYKKFKQSKKAINNFINSRSIPVVGINLKTKKIIYFKSIAEAAKKLKDQSSNISKCCKGKLRYIKNYVLVYKKDYNPNKDYTKLKPRDFSHTKNEITNIKRAKANPNSRKVFKFNVKNELIEEYYSVSSCEKINKIKKDTLKYKILNRTLIRGYLYSYNKNNI